jgi:hypothetical protein
MTTAPSYTKFQLEQMAEVVADYPEGPFSSYYKQVLASYTLTPDIKAVEEAPKSYGTGGPSKGGKKPYSNAATPKQLDYIGKLLTLREVPTSLRTLATSPDLTFKTARTVIDALKLCPWLPKEPKKVAGKTVGDGFYCHDGAYYKAQYGAKTNNLYCKKWDGVEWGYVGQAPLAFLTESDRLTKEQASAFGALYGRCVKCTRRLTDEYSIEHGYGKICAGKLGW